MKASPNPSKGGALNPDTSLISYFVLRTSYFLAFAVLLIFSCHKKQKKAEESFFPVLSYIKSQVAHIDTSIYPIQKIIIIDSTHSDTTDVRREEFRELAKDFLTLPDLAEKQYAKRFKEEKLYDASLNTVIINYSPLNAEKEEIQGEEVLIIPQAPEDKVKNIIINTMINNRDGFLQKKMLWKIDESFQVTTISQKPGQPETTITLKVTWNETPIR
ncbi:MAG TPA: hypothetical protein VLJ68_06500 [Chitinophagaceae bacterium]|nr:hypothetical protein [Chitinophagaceae bacterium]